MTLCVCIVCVFPRESEDLVTGKELHQELGGFGEILPHHSTHADMPYTHVLRTTLMVCVVLCCVVLCCVVPGASGRLTGAAVDVIQHGREAEGDYGVEEPEGEGEP